MNNQINPQKQLSNFDLELLYGCVGYDYMQACEPRAFNNQLLAVNSIGYQYAAKAKGVKPSNEVNPSWFALVTIDYPHVFTKDDFPFTASSAKHYIGHSMIGDCKS